MRVTKALEKKRQECKKLQAKHIEPKKEYNTKIRAIQSENTTATFSAIYRYPDHHYVTKKFDKVSSKRYEFFF